MFIQLVWSFLSLLIFSAPPSQEFSNEIAFASDLKNDPFPLMVSTLESIEPTISEISGGQGLQVEVVDALSGRPLPARVAVYAVNGQLVLKHFDFLPGVFTDQEGALDLPLVPGRYEMKVYHGIDYLSQNILFELFPM